MHGMDAYGAAHHCAAVSAAKRVVGDDAGATHSAAL